eukprot:TRINITY_DN34_c0_g1_i2.p1 TRINITY_DN34_c0_g1~~TRINITY_DN34_c0_g1_i2.p1  ORF type:complete len:451 (+),score=66.60 TRINITY_DN34_c0_g1_i2:4331-5683(+)
MADTTDKIIPDAAEAAGAEMYSSIPSSGEGTALLDAESGRSETLVSDKTWPIPGDAPTPTGTIFSSAMNLAACALGASMLSLPYAMMISGPIVAMQFIGIFAVMAFISAQAIVNAGLRCGKSSYDDIVRHYFGFGQGLVAEILLAVALIVAAISYIVGLADLLPKMLPIPSCVVRDSLILITLIVLFPVTLIGNLAAFGPASAIAAAGCYLQAAALVMQLFTNKEWETPPPETWESVNLGGLIYSLPMICFVYAFHYVLTETLCELRNSTRMRMALVNATTIGIQIGCYIPVALAGYLIYSGKGITTNVLEGLPSGSFAGFVATWSIGGLLLITYSLFIIPLRQKLEKKLFGSLTSSMRDVKRIGLAAVLNLFVALAAVSLPDLGLANTLAGGCIALIMFFFPGRLMVRFQSEKDFEERDPLRLVIGGTFVFFGGLICLVGLFGNLIFKF